MSKPSGTRCNSSRLRTSSAAPIKQHRRQRKLPAGEPLAQERPDAAARRATRRLSSARSRRSSRPCHAGARPNTIPVSSVSRQGKQQDRLIDARCRAPAAGSAAASHSSRSRRPTTRPRVPLRRRHPRARGSRRAAAEQPPTCRAERRAHRHLLLPLERPRQQQVRDVGADDQQHEATAPSSTRSAVRSWRAHERVGERHEVDAPVLHLGVLLPDASRDRVHLRLRAPIGDARLQPADDEEDVIEAQLLRRVDDERHPDVARWSGRQRGAARCR